MSIGRDTPLRSVAFEVCTALERAGTRAVLSGGGAATLHAPDAIQSYDLDFVLQFQAQGGADVEALAGLGYSQVGFEYRHAESPFHLDFPPGPLAIGDDLVRSWDTLREGELLLHLLTPTDSCRDRLAAFYHFRDSSALDQALSIYRAVGNRIHMAAISEWSEREGAATEFQEFARRAAE